MDFGRFDAVVFGSVVPDEVHLQQAGGYRFVASLYHELFSTIQAQTNLYVVGASGARNIEQPSEVYYMYADLAEATGARFVSLRDFIVEHGEAIVAGDAPRMGDEAHVHPAIGQQFGHYLGRVIADTLRDRRPARNFARNFPRVAAGHVYDGKCATRQTRQAARRFAEMGLGDRLRLGSPGRLVGMHVDYWKTYCFARLSGPDGSLLKRLYVGNRPGKMLLQFIPVPGSPRVEELEIVPPGDSYQDSLVANIEPVVPAPVASICGLAFWNGDVRDLGLSLRGKPVQRFRIPVLDPRTPLVVSVRDMPAERGWHAAAARPDGWSRWTGPDSESHLIVDCVPGRFAMRLRVLGAAVYEALAGLGISIDGVAVPSTIEQDSAVGYVVTAVFAVSVAGRKTIVLRVPAMRDGYGLEVAGVEFRGVGGA